MDLLDAICVVVNSWNAGRPDEVEIYKKALEMVETHSDSVLFRERLLVSKSRTAPLAHCSDTVLHTEYNSRGQTQ
jgi:hypothetical protein